MQKVKTVSAMAEKINGKFCSVVLENARTNERRFSAKIGKTTNNYVHLLDTRNRRTMKVQYSTVKSIGCGEAVYHR